MNKLQFDIRVYMICFILVGFNNIKLLNAATVNMTLTSDANGLLSVTDNSATSNLSLSTTSNTATEWTASYEDNSILILPSNDINIPIELEKRAIVLTHRDRGRFVFSDGKMGSLTRTPLLRSSASLTSTYNYRPTLFVTLQGAAQNGGPDIWQNDFHTRIQSMLISPTAARHSQFVHFQVDWDSLKPMSGQVKNLTGQIRSFLSQRANKWDVVIVGFSRGGIFANTVSKKIFGHNKINNLHTFLLDPTAARPFGDLYPNNFITPVRTNVFGSMYYDNALWIDPPSWVYALLVTSSSNFFTVSDKPINGFTNYGRNDVFFSATGHFAFASEWLNSAIPGVGLTQALDDIWAQKEEIVDGFLQDGITNNLEVITIKARAIIADIDISIVNGNLTIASQVAISDVPFSSVSVAGEVGVDGLSVAIATSLTSSQLSVNEDGIAISESADVIGNVSSWEASANKDGVFVQVSTIDAVSVSASVGKGDIAVSAELFGNTYNISYKDTETAVSNFGKKIANEVSNVVKRVFRVFGF